MPMPISRSSGIQQAEAGTLQVARATSRKIIAQVIAWWVACVERMRQRRALRHFDDRLLADIGISRCDAEREIEKPFWK